MYPEAITLYWQALQFCRNGALKIDMFILPVMLYIFDATCMIGSIMVKRSVQKRIQK